MKTYDQWLREGRAVRKGEKAEYYLVSPDGSRSRAVFTPEQTEPYADPAEGWTDLVTAEEREAAKGNRPPKVIVDYADGQVRIWCGSDKTAIGSCQRGGYTYNPSSHRWTATKTQHDAVRIIRVFEHYGYDVTSSLPDSVLSPAI